ncbi:MAG: hypothetical protein JW892_13085 [Anaerolineae bacterium]|nr:hypothetical protein [Anaerolineae bacterium]
MPTPKLLDLYKPELPIDFAKGYYARVYSAINVRVGDRVAFKVLRPEHTHNGKEGREYQAFGLEARLLQHLSRCPTVVKLVDCGFLSDKHDLPASGHIVSLGLDVAAFNAEMEDYRARGWRPYLCETLMPEPDNLFVKLRENGRQRRRRLPTEDVLALAWQYTKLLEKAHKDDIVYLDVKLEHFYWDGETLCVIDWNSSRLLSDPASQNEDSAVHKKNDIRNFAVGVLYPILTGVSPLGQFREMPSNRDAAENRYRAVSALDFDMEPSLSPNLIGLVRNAADGEFANLLQFKNALETCASDHGWNPGSTRHPSESARRAWEATHEAMDAIRRAQRDLQLAREALQKAMEQGDPHLDGEAERLFGQVNKLWEERVLP